MLWLQIIPLIFMRVIFHYGLASICSTDNKGFLLVICALTHISLFLSYRGIQESALLSFPDLIV